MDFIKPTKIKKNVKKEIFEFILYNIDPKMDLIYDKNINTSNNKNNIEDDFYNINENLDANIPQNNNKKINNTKIKYLSMVDIHNNDIQNACKLCFNCHRKFNTNIIGVPIKYIPNVLITTFKTENNSYKLKKNISTNEYNTLKNNLNNNQTIVQGDYFIIDSIVCSFNCALSIYNENPIYYKETPQLLNLMYYKIYNKYPTKILPAPSFKLRKEYNGPLSEEEYEKLLETYNVIEHPQLHYKISNKLFECF
jgi:hypothetical protein